MKEQRDYRTFGVWDIETSTTKDKDGHPIDTWLSYGVCGIYRTKDGAPLIRRAFTTWDEFAEILESYGDLLGRRSWILYAHNFAFEGDFLFKNVGHAEKVIANGVHRPISVHIDREPWVDFRCSWKLLDESVEKIGKRVGLPKLEDDYAPIPRGQKPGPEKIKYCTRDCDIVALGIAEMIREYHGNIWKVPLTKTGIVRGALKEYCKEQDPKRSWDFPPPPDCWDAERNAFYGGITLANPEFVGLDVPGVWSFDMSSAYPFAALSEQFPRTIRRADVSEWGTVPFWIARIEFVNIRSRFAWSWLPSSRIEWSPDTVRFNGKIVESRAISLCICSTDMKCIELTYTWDEMHVVEFYACEDVGPLPRPVYNLFSDLAESKQTAKIRYKENPTNENAIAYAKNKSRFNSLYGMMVQSPETEDFQINEIGEWSVVENKIEDAPHKHSCRNYLFGVWITAYCRRNLLRFAVTNAGNRLVYMDTDSCKFVPIDEKQIVIDTNADARARIDHEKVGNLGEWEREKYPVTEDENDPRRTETIDLFRCYGAKKYWYRTGEVNHVTVAGLPHRMPDRKTPIDTTPESFRLGHTWKNVKLARSFLYFGRATTIDESLNVLSSIPAASDAGGVALYEVGYTLDITKSDRHYLKLVYNREVV